MLTPEGFTRRSIHAQGNKLRRQIAPSVLENFCENLCGCKRILLPQQVVQIQSDFIFCDLLQRQNSVAATNIFTHILQYRRSDSSLRRVAATCCCNYSPDLYTRSGLSPRLVTATCRLVCTDQLVTDNLLIMCSRSERVKDENGNQSRTFQKLRHEGSFFVLRMVTITWFIQS